MDALIVLLVYVLPFVIIGVIANRWIARKGVTLSDARAEAGHRRRSRFLLGVWRRDDPE